MPGLPVPRKGRLAESEQGSRMAGMTPVEVSAGGRWDVIADRLAVLRGQAAELGERVQTAETVAAGLRQAARPGCSHAAEVHELQNAITALEHELSGLHTAMGTRATIEQAKGMIMLREGCDGEAAFALLVRLSQHSHRKLHEVAGSLIESWTRGGHGRPAADGS